MCASGITRPMLFNFFYLSKDKTQKMHYSPVAYF